MGCLPTFRMHEVAIATLAKAVYGVDLSTLGEKDLARVE